MDNNKLIAQITNHVNKTPTCQKSLPLLKHFQGWYRHQESSDPTEQPSMGEKVKINLYCGLN